MIARSHAAAWQMRDVPVVFHSQWFSSFFHGESTCLVDNPKPMSVPLTHPHGVSSPLKRKHITLSQRIRDRYASGKGRCGVRSVDALDQIKQLARNATQFSDQLLRSFRRRIAFLDLCIYKQSRLQLRDSLLAISA
jgi:hypothetical protein